MINEYLDLVNHGKNSWLRYLAAFLIIICFWQGVGSIFYIALVIKAFIEAYSGNTGNAIDLNSILDPKTGMVQGQDTLLVYIALNLSFVCFFIGILIAVKFIHERKLITLITPRKSISYKRFFIGFGVYFILVSLSTLADFAVAPDSYSMSLNLEKFLISLPFVLVLTPIQTTTEELFFRGYILQSMNRITRNVFALTIINGTLFMLPHLINPEVFSALKQGILPLVSSALYYFCCGLLLAVITVKSRSLELAMGLHAANNLFGALFVGFKESALQTYTVFYTTRYDPVFSLISFIVVALLFYFIVFKVLKVNNENTNPTLSA